MTDKAIGPYWDCDCFTDGEFEDKRRVVRASLYDALVSHIATHDTDCQALCGIGEAEAVACGYRPYFLNNGRRCPTCPVHDQIGFPDDRGGK